VPDRNEVGYPISVHADIGAHVTVNSFTVQARGGVSLPALIVTPAGDSGNSSSSAAAIVPLSPLAHNTTYDVQFAGGVDGIPATRSWSFTTQ
jgi:hypothetical protein